MFSARKDGDGIRGVSFYWLGSIARESNPTEWVHDSISVAFASYRTYSGYRMVRFI